MDRDAARVMRFGRDPGPGFARFERHGVLRVSDLVPPEVAPADVRAALGARGVVEGDREVPAPTSVRALLTTTAAGTVITLERRGDARHPRVVVLRRLTRLLEALVTELEIVARGSRKPPETRQNPPPPGRDETVTIGIRSVPGGFASTPEA